MLATGLSCLLAVGSLVDMTYDLCCCVYGPKVNVLQIEAFQDWLLRYLRDTLLFCFVCVNCVLGFDCLDKGWSKKVSCKYELSSGDPRSASSSAGSHMALNSDARIKVWFFSVYILGVVGEVM